MKICNKCGIEKPESDFYANKKICKLCFKFKRIEYVFDHIQLKEAGFTNKEIAIVEFLCASSSWRDGDNQKKRCSHCGFVKPFSEFYVRSNGKPIGECIECKTYKQNMVSDTMTPEERKAYNRKYYDLNYHKRKKK